jgi:hypothetical protein
MSWNCNALMQRMVSFKNDMASRLMNPAVFPLPTETRGQIFPANVTRQLSLLLDNPNAMWLEAGGVAAEVGQCDA